MPTRRGALVLLLACLAGIAGCGGAPSSAGKFEGDERAVAEVVEDLQVAGERQETAVICNEILAPALRGQMQAQDARCEEEMEKAIKDADAFDLEVQSVTITGTRATARVKGRDHGCDVVRTFEFEKDRGGWRATSFGGV